MKFIVIRNVFVKYGIAFEMVKVCSSRKQAETIQAKIQKEDKSYCNYRQTNIIEWDGKTPIEIGRYQE